MEREIKIGGNLCKPGHIVCTAWRYFKAYFAQFLRNDKSSVIQRSLIGDIVQRDAQFCTIFFSNPISIAVYPAGTFQKFRGLFRIIAIGSSFYIAIRQGCIKQIGRCCFQSRENIGTDSFFINRIGNCLTNSRIVKWGFLCVETNKTTI